MKKSPISILAAACLLTFSSCGNNPVNPVKNTYTVSFNSHGGSPVADLVDVSVVEESPATTRSGYDFKGWYVDTTYTSDKKVSFPYIVTEDITLHANWEKAFHYDDIEVMSLNSGIGVATAYMKASYEKDYLISKR